MSPLKNASTLPALQISDIRGELLATLHVPKNKRKTNCAESRAKKRTLGELNNINAKLRDDRGKQISHMNMRKAARKEE
ncbi:hypothetical protein SK128_002189 [Halocaridina rubra]|uniref:Uncharacterized protein n=1 Tax=Halocaridina rubra TaxID=373956 RepID=A0AAN9ACS9_HALRR